jgi:hypothetical protein
MSTRLNNAGIVLAIIAGLAAFGVATWPITPPQGRGDMNAIWGIGQWLVGLAFITSAFLAARHLLLAKTILAIGSLSLVIAALISAEILRTPTLTWLAAVLELLPVALGLLSAALLGPIEMTGRSWEIRQVLRSDDHPLQEQAMDRAA